MKTLEPKPPGTLWATPGLLRDFYTFAFYPKQFNNVLSLPLPQHVCLPTSIY